MAEKKCPKCGKSFDDSWKLCDNCGVELVIPSAMPSGSLFSSRLKDRFKRIDMALDSRMGKAVETADEAKESIGVITKSATKKATEITEKAEKKALVLEKKGMAITRRMRRASAPQTVIDNILNYPQLILVGVILITLVIGVAGIPAMLNNITGEMTIYLAH
jgi:hypothetical protein